MGCLRSPYYRSKYWSKGCRTFPLPFFNAETTIWNPWRHKGRWLAALSFSVQWITANDERWNKSSSPHRCSPSQAKQREDARSKAEPWKSWSLNTRGRLTAAFLFRVLLNDLNDDDHRFNSSRRDDHAPRSRWRFSWPGTEILPTCDRHHCVDQAGGLDWCSSALSRWAQQCWPCPRSRWRKITWLWLLVSWSLNTRGRLTAAFLFSVLWKVEFIGNYVWFHDCE